MDKKDTDIIDDIGGWLAVYGLPILFFIGLIVAVQNNDVSWLGWIVFVGLIGLAGYLANR